MLYHHRSHNTNTTTIAITYNALPSPSFAPQINLYHHPPYALHHHHHQLYLNLQQPDNHHHLHIIAPVRRDQKNRILDLEVVLDPSILENELRLNSLLYPQSRRNTTCHHYHFSTRSHRNLTHIKNSIGISHIHNHPTKHRPTTTTNATNKIAYD